MEHALKILGKASSINVRKVLWTCDELDLSYEREDWGSGFASTHSPEFLRLNPNAQVPVIIDDGRRAVGVQHHLPLPGRQTPAHAELLPHEPAARARVEQWMDWQATELNPSVELCVHGAGAQRPGMSRTPHRIARSACAAGTRKWPSSKHQLAADRSLCRRPTISRWPTSSLGLSVNRWLMTPMATTRLPGH